MGDAGHRMIDHALGLDWARLPAAAQRAARVFFHDTICVGIAGRGAVNADLVWQVAPCWGGSGAAQVLGRPGAATSPAYAAFVNAFQIHAQEYDCVHEPAVAHPMASVVAVLLAETAQAAPITGATFLAALVAGVDIVATLGVAVTTPLKFFRPATAGIFGSVAAIARLRGLDRATAIDAFGHALAFTSGTMQAHLEGKPVLALQVAAAARSAIEAVDLAAAGITAPVNAIEGPFGYFALFEGGVDLAPALAELGSRQRITELSWKPFPTGRAGHGAIVAIQQLAAQGLTPDTLDRLTYRAPPLIARLVGRRPQPDMTAAYARLCLAYLGAVTLRRGTVTLDDFGAEALTDRQTLALADRIVVEPDDNPDPAAFVPATAIARLSDGRIVCQDVTRQFGSPEWPLSDVEHFAKTSACLAFGGMARADDALRIIFDRFDGFDDVRLALAPAFG